MNMYDYLSWDLLPGLLPCFQVLVSVTTPQTDSNQFIMHLSSSSPRGGGPPGCRWGNWGLCGDLEAYLCPYAGANEGPLLYYAPDHEEIWGLPLKHKEIADKLSSYAVNQPRVAFRCESFGKKN